MIELEHPLWRRWLCCEGVRSFCLPRTRPTRSRFLAGDNRRHMSRTASTSTWSTAAKGGESGRTGHQGRRRITGDVCGRSRRVGCASARWTSERRALGREFDRIFAAPTRMRPTNSTRTVIPRAPDATECHAPGPRRPAVEQTVLSLRRPAMAERRSGVPPPPPERRYGRNHEWRHLTTPTSSPCPTNGNIRGSPHGIWLFTASPWRWSIPTSPKNNSFC